MHFSSIAYGLAVAGYTLATPMIQVLEHRNAAPDPDRWHDIQEHGESLAQAGTSTSVIEGRGLTKSVDISRRWVDKKLFEGSLSTVPFTGGGGKGSQVQGIVTLSIQCIECYSKGTIDFSLSTSRGSENGETIGDGIPILEELSSIGSDLSLPLLTDKLTPVLRIDLSNVEVYAEMQISLEGSLTYQWRLWVWDTTPFADTSNLFNIGPYVALDLVFSVSSTIEIETGFHITLPPDAFFEIDVGSGNITNKLFKGTKTRTLPVKVDAGNVTFTAGLRISAGADLGIGPAISPANVAHGGAAAPAAAPNPGVNPGTNPGANPGANPGGSPGGNPGSNPGGNQGNNPGTGTQPGTDPGNSNKKPENNQNQPQAAKRSTSVNKRSLERRIIAGGIGVQAFLNLIEWNAQFTPDFEKQTNCSLMLETDTNMNYGVGGYFLVRTGPVALGHIPNTSWRIMESQPTSTCLKPRVQATAGAFSNDTAAAPATTTPPAPKPTGNQVVVQEVLTTCKSAIVNCPSSLIGTVTMNNTVEASAATEFPQAAGNNTEPTGSARGLRSRIKKKLNGLSGLFARDEEEGDAVPIERIPEETVMPATRVKPRSWTKPTAPPS